LTTPAPVIDAARAKLTHYPPSSVVN